MKILKLEPYSGISGDMFLGALAPLLDAEDLIRSLPDKLHLPDVEVTFEDVIRSTIQCRKATVVIRGKPDVPADHDHTHSHGAHSHHHHHAEGPQSHDHSHDHEHHHHHEQMHDHSHTHDHHHVHTHPHDHRSYQDIVHLIQQAHLSDGAKQLAFEMFKRLGEAEASMHGMELENVHFHEVGGEDSIIDIVGAAVLIDLLKPDQVVCSPIAVGHGYVKTAHGRLPVPAPATERILQGMPTFPGPIEKEMTTPTGAVILSVLDPTFTIPVLTVHQTGMGAGTRDLSQPNALRVSLCSTGKTGNQEEITLLQTNLDQLSGEALGSDLIQDILDQGALDAWLSPIVMKKGRPAHKLEVLCRAPAADSLSSWILEQLPTLGIRRFEGNRTILERSQRTIDTAYGPIQVKVHHLADGRERLVPEYESCRKASLEHGVPIQTVRDSVLG